MKIYTLQIILIAIMAISFIGLTMNIVNMKQENSKLRKELDYYEQTYQIKAGGTVLCNDSNNWVDYNLRTFDGGKIWYATKYKDDTLKVLGEANIVYPGLIKCLEAWNKIENYITKNGPITIKQIEQHDSIIMTMKEAGITIVKK